MTALLAAGAVLLAAFIKGAIGFGFPTLATPLLALFIDVKTAVAVLILPNIVMDGIQFARRGAPLATVRRLAMLLISGSVGTVLGTRLLVILPARVATLVLGGFILGFTSLNATRFSLRCPPAWERWLSPPVGFIAGVAGGLTNTPGTTLVLYFYALGMDKAEFVRSIAFSFVVYKLVQLGAVAYSRLLTWPLLGVSLALTLVALGGFALGLRVQDRLNQAAFNRAVLIFLGALGVGLVVRGAR